jgi:hypothetical protein
MHKVLVFTLLFFFISGLFTSAFSSVSAELVEDSWSTINAMDQSRHDFGVIAVDDKIYAIGGYAFSEYLTANERYDPKADQWITIASMPTPRSNFIIVACQGKIYCIGGTTANDGTFSVGPLLTPKPPTGTTAPPIDGPIYVQPPSRPIDVVEAYDIAANKWANKEHLPINVEGMQAQVVNEQIFIITPNGELYMYNPADDKWSNKAPLPVKDGLLQTHVINEQIFAITQRSMYMYDLAKDTWLNKTSIPTPMTYAFSAVMDNSIVIGDFLYTPEITYWTGLFSAQLRIRIYDPTTDVWQDGKPSVDHIFVRDITTIITTGVYAPKNVYILGLEASKEDLYNVKPFTWVYNPIDDVWSTAKVDDAASYSRMGITTIVDNDVFYTIGGIYNFKYIPIGYNQAPPISEDDSSSGSSESEPLWPFLTVIAVGIIVLTASVVTVSLYFYLRKKNNKRNKYE